MITIRHNKNWCLQRHLFMIKSNQHIDKCFVPKKEDRFKGGISK